MKRVINGKRYDTETATKIANWDNGCYSTDFNYVDEDLYLTKSGNWFLWGSGGANSQYAQYYGNSRGGSSTIIPFDKDDAYNWLEEHNFVDEIETYFADKIVDA